MAAIHITERRLGEVTILDLDGRLVLEEGEIPLRDAVDRLVAEGRVKIVLGLDRVSVLDSAGIGMLVCKYLTTFRKGGRVKLLRPTARTEQLLRLTRLWSVFEVFDAEDAAVRSFDGQPS